MSEIRKVEVDVDIDLMEETANSLGLRTMRNAAVRGYAISKENADLVVSDGSGYDVGFKRRANGKVEMMYDNWQGHADKMIQRVMPVYKEKLIIQRGSRIGWRVGTRMETAKEIILRLRR